MRTVSAMDGDTGVGDVAELPALRQRAFLSILEAATVCREPCAAWASRVSSRVAESTGADQAMMMDYEVEAEALSPLHSAPKACLSIVDGVHRSLDTRQRRQVYGASASAHTATELLSDERPALWERAGRVGVRDVLGVAAPVARGRALSLAVLLPRPSRLSAAGRERMRALGAHIDAVRKVRDALIDGGTLPGGCERSTPPTGLAARLRDAARELDRRRARAERHPTGLGAEEADALWLSLLRDGWALIPVETSAYRTRVIAVRVRAQKQAGLRGLTVDELAVVRRVAEGASNKEIAYEQDTTESTVADRLQRAQQRLGLTSRMDLVRVFGALANAA